MCTSLAFLQQVCTLRYSDPIEPQCGVDASNRQSEPLLFRPDHPITAFLPLQAIF